LVSSRIVGGVELPEVISGVNVPSKDRSGRETSLLFPIVFGFDDEDFG